MGFFNRLNGFAQLTPEMRAALTVLCGPTEAAWTLADGLAVFAMWVAMVFAMMLPSAAPVLTSFARLAEEKRRAGEPAASPLLIAAGYLAIWIAFAAVATAAQALLTQLRVLTPAGTTASQLLAGTTLIAAGLYQFSPLKMGCLTRCRHPAPYFAENWTARRAAVFRQGIEQGIDCLGCCWALMVVMFAVGVMNVVWIAVIGAVMTVEKVTTSLSVPRIVGLVLLSWGAALVLVSPVGTALLLRFHLM
jgi:predicted metal-binding membrane protein